MKKILSIMTLALVALAFVSCSNNSPEAVVQEYVADLQAGKYEEALDLFYFRKELTDKDKQQYISMMTEKWGKEIDKKGGITGVDITDVAVAEDGNTATVNYTLKYGDGSTKDQNTSLVKVDDKWKIDAGK